MVVRRVRQCGAARRDPPGHAEMQQQKSVRIQLDQDVFPAPAERADARAVEARGKGGRKRPPQIGPAQLRLHDAAAAHLQGEPAPDRLDLRQFGHRSSNAEEVQMEAAAYNGSNWRIVAWAILYGYLPAR